MIIGRLHAIPDWGTISTSSTESDEQPSLTDVKGDNLEDSHYRLNPLWPENISESLPSELQPFLLSRPVRPQHLQDKQTYRTKSHGNDERVESINEGSSLFGDKTNHSISEQSSLFDDDETDHTISEESSLFGDSDETDSMINKVSTPASLPQDHTVFLNVGSQPPAGQHYTWTPSNVGLQHPDVQHDAPRPSGVEFQPPVGRHYACTPSNIGIQYPEVPHNARMPSNIGMQHPAIQNDACMPSYVGIHHPGVQHDVRMPSSVGFQPSMGRHYTWTPSNVGIQHVGVQHAARVPSGVGFQPLPGAHYYWMRPSLGASGMMMLPPSNSTYTYGITTAFPPSAQFNSSANAFTAPPPSTSSFRHGTCPPGTKQG
ncbi:uncharacterized protein F5891DRAFT_716042 [Suillus fuscotomentosus]|uniref:Uncharacterized protein n=1 Tax=Suillus fuscotomentosus TaxID=1912939 RepID=A0AAD4HFS7_9AGAM|nr:uncharacterized protein F5891DRAFT_716042 [Suillus fuscotomentosus]KAG1894581.1 hypothetical protein F5891DRAFT_716042 [Suillus fuscotomentosus]